MSQTITQNFWECKTPNLLTNPQEILGLASRAMIDWRKLTVSERLRVLRKSRDLSRDVTQIEFSKLLGETENSDAYGMAERTGNLSNRLANKICATCPGIDQGWLYAGAVGNVPPGVEKRLSEAAGALGLQATERASR